jgi:DnaK suppressor protein
MTWPDFIVETTGRNNPLERWRVVARPDALLRLHKSLLARGAALRSALAGEVEHLRRFRTDQTGDSASAAFDSGSEEMSGQLAELEARELNQIERALTRLKQGTYGTCEVCQARIPVARLNALPYSTTCVSCQRAMEGSPGQEGRRGGGGWERIYDAEPALEEQRDVSLADIEQNLSRNR